MLILYYVFKIVICNVIKVALPTLFTVLCCGGSACVVNKKKKKTEPQSLPFLPYAPSFHHTSQVLNYYTHAALSDLLVLGTQYLFLRVLKFIYSLIYKVKSITQTL